MAKLKQNFEKPTTNGAKNVDYLLNRLFADVKTVYIDDVNFRPDGGYDVSYCLDYTLKMGQPYWLDISLSRPQLLQLVKAEKLNEWESFGYDAHTGNLQPVNHTDHNLEAFLDEHYHEVIKIYLESNT